MHRKIINSWEALWAAGSKAGGTHWNYSRGLVRFRPMRKRPSALGVENHVDSEDPVRVRFYVLEDARFVERFRSEVLFQPPSNKGMAFPPGFRSWDRDRKAQHLDTMIQRLSSRRDPEQKAPIVQDLIRALEIVREQLPAKPRHQPDLPGKHAPAAEPQPKPQPAAEMPKPPPPPSQTQPKPQPAAQTQPPAEVRHKTALPPPPARINDFWEFLEHPNAEKGITALLGALTPDKELPSTLMDLIKHLPALKAAGLLP